MSQHDMNLINAPGAQVRSDINDALVALASNNSGATDPATKFAYMPWADSTSGIFKIRNAANTGWISLFTIATGKSLLAAAADTVAVADAAADTTTWPMLATSQTGNQAPTTDAGLTYNASTNTLTATTFAGNLSGGTVAGTSVTSSGAVTSSSPTAGIGYATGAGGSATQATSKATGVTVNKISGSINTAADALAGGASVTFLFTNSTMSSLEILHVQTYAMTPGRYSISVDNQAGSAYITIKNETVTSYAETIYLKFAVFKLSTS